MARGPRKSLDDKIREKSEVIEALKVRIKAEQMELEEIRENLSQKSMCRKEFPFGHMSLWRYTENCNRCV